MGTAILIKEVKCSQDQATPWCNPKRDVHLAVCYLALIFTKSDLFLLFLFLSSIGVLKAVENVNKVIGPALISKVNFK